MQNRVPLLQRFRRNIVVAHRIRPHAPRQGRAVGAGHRIAFQQQTQLYLQRGIGMVCGQPPDSPGPDQIGARIPHMRNGRLVVAKNRRQQRRGHAPGFAALQINLVGRLVINLAHQVVHRCPGLGLFENLQGDLGGHPARDFAVSQPAHPVRQRRDAAHALQQVIILRLPERDKVLVMIAHRSGAGKLETFDFHGRSLGKTPRHGKAPKKRRQAGLSRPGGAFLLSVPRLIRPVSRSAPPASPAGRFCS